jgi:integrase
MQWLSTGMQVDEALKVRIEDVQRRRAKPPQRPTDRLFIMVKGGKLGYLDKPTKMVGLVDAVRAFERLKLLTPNVQPKAFLFPVVNPRNTVHHLLEAAGLRLDEDGQKRTSKSFRHTFIMTRLLSGVSVFTIARNYRTSVKMIERHYGSHLNAWMQEDEMTKMF